MTFATVSAARAILSNKSTKKKAKHLFRVRPKYIYKSLNKQVERIYIYDMMCAECIHTNAAAVRSSIVNV